MPLIAASRTYLPGEFIYSEEPFVHTLPKDVKDEYCESCRCGSFNLRACKQCLAVKYCGKACQRKDWRIHRFECQNMKNLDESNCGDLVRLLGRVILKIKGKDWTSFKRFVLGTAVSFDSIDPHYKEMTEDPHLNLMYKELKEDTRNFIGAGNMPTDTDFLKVTGKVIYNTILNLNDDDGVPGLNFFIGLFMFEHECIPNSSFGVKRNVLKVWASKKIPKGSEKITVSFRRLFGLNPRIRADDTDGKSCKCSDCSLPYGESVLSKILDDRKAFSMIKLTRKTLELGDTLSIIDLQSGLEGIVDKLLQDHAGVLGRTNVLHLKMLYFRYLVIGGRKSEVRLGLLALESVMRPVFGEFYIEMLIIYEALSLINLQLGNFEEGRQYLFKAEKIEELLE